MTQLGIHARDVKLAVQRSRTSARTIRLLTRPDPSVARAIWADIAVSGERDALIFTFTAITRAARWARRRDLRSEPAHRHIVMTQTARAHGFADSDELRQALGGSALWPWIEHTIEEAALAKRIRRELFAGGGHSTVPLDNRADQDCI